MKTLSDSQLLELWDRAARRGPVARSLALLGTAWPEQELGALADVSVVERDAALLRLRVDLFGAVLPGHVDCPVCRERQDIELDGRELAASIALPARGALAEAAGHRFRLPTSADLAAAAVPGADVAGATLILARRCCVPGDGLPLPAELGDAELEEIDRALSELADPAEIRLALTCIGCGHAWTAALDIGSYLWDELEEQASGLLDDVHLLALAYGWSEPEILALGEARRRGYLERCAS
jgi:hypothetical protein